MLETNYVGNLYIFSNLAIEGMSINCYNIYLRKRLSES